jgi:hypothetical protein
MQITYHSTIRYEYEIAVQQNFLDNKKIVFSKISNPMSLVLMEKNKSKTLYPIVAIWWVKKRKIY